MVPGVAGSSPVTHPNARVRRWSAPGRVNLLGEHTDYNGGLALPMAIDLRTVVTVEPRGDDLLRIRSRQRGDETVEVAVGSVRQGSPGGWAAYAAGVFAVLRRHELRVGGAEVVVDGQVPAGAGLSSSAALECAVAAAADDAFELGLSRVDLAGVAQEAENTIVGVPCGAMDQRVAMLARDGCALLLDFAADSAAPVRLPPGRAVVVVDTRVRHALADGQYAERRRLCEQAAAALGVRHLSEATSEQVDELAEGRLRAVARHVVTENQRVRAAVSALGAGDWRRFGTLMTASHGSLRDDFAVSCPELDVAVDALVGAGADGARMTGAGFGGSAIAVAYPELVPALTAAVEAAFSAAGFAAPQVLAVRASEGARRE